MNNIEAVKRRLDKMRSQEAGQIPSMQQLAVANQYHAALFSRLKELRASIKAGAKGAV
jgi:hypothetical protein